MFEILNLRRSMAKFITPITLILTALLLAACSNVPLQEPKASVEDRSSKSTAQDTTQREVAKVETGTATADPLNDPNSPLAKRSVYFDFDKYNIQDEFRPVIEAHARYLTGNTARKVVIEGNTDERGSREYNIGLGQRRAEAVRKALAALGVAENQMEAVSFGEEKPHSQGSNEAAWAENRRADLRYK